MEVIKQIDQSLFLFLNDIHSVFWDKAMFLFSSREIWIPFYLLIIYVIIKTFKRNSIYILILIGLSIALSDQFSVMIKNLAERLRPSNDPAISNLIHIVNNYRGGTFGFFSSHASNSFTIAVIASLLFKNRMFSILIFVWAIVVSYTRVYLGLHYPGDILTGWFWGALIGFGFYKLMVFIQQRYFKSNFPEIRKKAIKKEDSIQLLLFVIIYVATILVTINRLTKYQFFGQ
ncbi:MAG: phosphatase PAP2 family protein [Bacteroidota bacterium]|nr:phosphatase PAP2 family protein [Odoribacter sp.]MDP3643128.1 phosphatase PAP2 family protein [Bacteroidota bacterium]